MNFLFLPDRRISGVDWGGSKSNMSKMVSIGSSSVCGTSLESFKRRFCNWFWLFIYFFGRGERYVSPLSKNGACIFLQFKFSLMLVYLPRPAENTSGKLPFSSILIFSASAVMHSTFWQNVSIGWSQRLNFWNQSDPNKFSVYFFTKTFNFLVITFSDTGIIISPSNFILSPSCRSRRLACHLYYWPI